MLRIAYYCLLISCTVASCKKKPVSKPHLVNGVVIEDEKLPSAVQITLDLGNNTSKSCTAVWVSDRTVITAAHCMSTNQRTANAASIIQGMGKGAKAERIILHDAYIDSAVGNDLALVVFPKGSANADLAASISSVPPKADMLIGIVGYGKFDHADFKSAGAKRAGSNKLNYVAERLSFSGSTQFNTNDTKTADGVDKRSGAGNDVLNSQGDSGGPMYLLAKDWEQLFKTTEPLQNAVEGKTEDHLIGISSTVDAVADSSGRYNGHYINLLDASFLEFMKGQAQQFPDAIVIKGLDKTTASSTSVGSASSAVGPRVLQQEGNKAKADNAEPAKQGSSSGVDTNPIGAGNSTKGSEDGTCSCSFDSASKNCVVTVNGKVVAIARPDFDPNCSIVCRPNGGSLRDYCVRKDLQ